MFDWKINVKEGAQLPRLKVMEVPQKPVDAICHCSHKGTGVFLGNSSCTTMDTVVTSGPPRPVNGTYVICGSWAYPWLPGMPPNDGNMVGWVYDPHLSTGCCYLAYVVPAVCHFNLTKDHPSHLDLGSQNGIFPQVSMSEGLCSPGTG